MKINLQLKPALISYWMGKAFKTFHPEVNFYPSPKAPNTWKDLKRTSLSALPVFDGGCTSTIYNKPPDNYMFRAWHDALHIKHGLSFSYADEITIAKLHCMELRLIGAPVHVINAVWYDVAGQVEFYYKNGHFVDNQRQFVQDCLQYGLDRALLLRYDAAKNVQ